jgi:hypothetical protein
MIKVESPLAIVTVPCLEQLTLSPMRAMPTPSTSLWGDASTTLPPWEILSPSLINGPAMCIPPNAIVQAQKYSSTAHLIVISSNRDELPQILTSAVLYLGNAWILLKLLPRKPRFFIQRPS